MLNKKIRLDRYLVHVGYGSRSEVQKLIKQKRVSVNEQIINKPEYGVVTDEDKVKVNHQEVIYKEFYYFVMHKPGGVITATRDNKQETVIDLLDAMDQNKDLVPVGRLDKDTEGLLILTNDGVFAHQLLSPKKHVPKCYYAEVEGEVTQEDINEIARGIVLDETLTCLPGKLIILEAGKVSKVHLIIQEGKFHQVKRMMAKLGKPVSYLKRIQMGGFKLPMDLEKGSYRELTEEEVSQLKEGE